MDHFLRRELKFAVLVVALVFASACSSSKVDSGEESPETAASTDMMSDDPGTGDALASSDGASGGEANTDAVPPVTNEETNPPPADLAAAPPESTEPAPVPDVSTSSNEPPPVPAESPSLLQEPAPTALAASSNPPPAPAEEPVLTPSSGGSVSGEVTRYRVKKGDTLMKIAFENYGDLYRWKEILDGNQNALQDPNHIAPGTVILLSGSGAVAIERNGEKYLIKTGDTLGLISNEVYGTKAKWKKLWENNRQLIKNPNRIYAGFNLYYLPEGRMTQDQSLPFKGNSDPEQVATGPGTSEAERVPNSQK